MKIIDFGLAKVVIPGKKINESCGTPIYVAPEIFKNLGYSKEVDIWSIGIIAHALATKGKCPYPDTGDHNT